MSIRFRLKPLLYILYTYRSRNLCVYGCGPREFAFYPLEVLYVRVKIHRSLHPWGESSLLKSLTPARGDMRSAFRIWNCIRNKKYVNARLIPMERDTFIAVFGMSILCSNKVTYSLSRVDSNEKCIQCFGRKILRGLTI
jgi:hypothetical protein